MTLKQYAAIFWKILFSKILDAIKLSMRRVGFSRAFKRMRLLLCGSETQTLLKSRRKRLLFRCIAAFWSTDISRNTKSGNNTVMQKNEKCNDLLHSYILMNTIQNVKDNKPYINIKNFFSGFFIRFWGSKRSDLMAGKISIVVFWCEYLIACKSIQSLFSNIHLKEKE